MDPYFEVTHQDGSARAGRLHLEHGTIETPVFMPVGTYGAVKSTHPQELKDTGTQILLGNTYHLYLRPGLEVLEQFGGLHKFMQWDGPILTDSGGFQIFSLSRLKKVDDSGAVFQSHLNGDTITLTPERAAEIQQVIGSDIAMVLDECVALPNSLQAMQTAVDRSIAWAKRFLEVPKKPGQRVFGIGQGGNSLELRLQSLERTLELDIDGIAIGGLSVGEPHEEMLSVLETLSPHLPNQLPHYLMGVGTPLDLLEAVARGIDMFDCVLPTRNARNGGLFTDGGLLNIRNHCYRLDTTPLDPLLPESPTASFSRAYLRHLFQTKEILGCRLATLHNLYYYHRLMQSMRLAIRAGTFRSFYEQMQPKLKAAYGTHKKVEETNETSYET